MSQFLSHFNHHYHKKKKKLVTLTAVRPPARFGYLKLKGNSVKFFKEKSNTDVGWINGGFFVIHPDFLKLIKGDKTYLEREPLELLTKKKQLSAFKHENFWQCIEKMRQFRQCRKVGASGYMNAVSFFKETRLSIFFKLSAE